MQPARLLVQPARRAKPGEFECAAHVLDAAPQHVERTPTLDLGIQPPQKPLLHLNAVVLGQSPHSFGCVASTKSTTSFGNKHSSRS